MKKSHTGWIRNGGKFKRGTDSHNPWTKEWVQVTIIRGTQLPPWC